MTDRETARPLLHARFPALRQAIAWLPLGDAPTPVRRLAGLEALPGEGEVWLKDDGVFGSAWGGNKARKLEWVLADVLRRRRRTILTMGALGTNHGLATALYAREHGVRTALMLVDQPWDQHVERQFGRIERSGARIHRTRGTARTVASFPFVWAANTDWRRLRPPYWLGVGGSSPLGTLGYVEAALELAEQVESGALPEPSHVVVALGSGGTVAGLVLGLSLAGLRTHVVAVQVNDRAPLGAGRIMGLAKRSERLLRRRGADLPRHPVTSERLSVETAWLGRGYGHRTAEGDRALELAREEGLRLEPVYTAKAVAALLALRERGGFVPGPVLYWHTHDALGRGMGTVA